jgi:hypothetical protein
MVFFIHFLDSSCLRATDRRDAGLTKLTQVFAHRMTPRGEAWRLKRCEQHFSAVWSEEPGIATVEGCLGSEPVIRRITGSYQEKPLATSIRVKS